MPNFAQVLSAFECPVCLDYMMPPYLQCQSGHLVCGNCRPKLTCCPTCRGPVREFFFCGHQLLVSSWSYFLDNKCMEIRDLCCQVASVPFKFSDKCFSASVRNLILEKIANTLMFPCKFSNSGCPLTFSHVEKVEHEEVCEFR